MRDFESLFRTLTANRVEFVLVGGLAAAAYGVTVVTQDVDLCIPFVPENLGRLVEALRPGAPKWRNSGKAFVESAEQLSGFKNLYLTTEWGALDLLGAIAGIGDFAAVEQQSTRIDLFGNPCRVLELDALIIAKSALHRGKDQEALVQLRAIRDGQTENKS